MGRPSDFDQTTADRICSELAKSGSLRAVCRLPGMPARTTVARWATEHEQFAAEYARAKQLGIDNFVEETLEIADDASNDWMEANDPDNPGWRVNGEHTTRSKIRIGTRQWLAERMLPRSYGPKAGLEMSGPDGGAVPIVIVTGVPRSDDFSDLA